MKEMRTEDGPIGSPGLGEDDATASERSDGTERRGNVIESDDAGEAGIAAALDPEAFVDFRDLTVSEGAKGDRVTTGERGIQGADCR